MTNTDNVKKVLQKSTAYLKQGHIKGTFARDAEGKEVGSTDPRATCWCSMGALIKASDDVYHEGGYKLGATELYRLRNEALARVAKAAGEDSVVQFNDAEETTTEEVIAAFEEAIAAL